MKPYFIWSFLVLLVLASTSVKADCVDEKKEDDSFFKKVGCQLKKGAEDAFQSVKKGAEDGYEAVKPLGDKIATSAKDFGSTVAKKYDEVKHKLTDENVPIDNKQATPIVNEPTEKIPLAPIAGHTDVKTEAKSATE